MNNTMTIAKREIHSYFSSPVAYIILALFLLISGWFFSTDLFLVNEASMRNIFTLVPIMFIFFIPAITMRTIAEERRSGTIELLCTTPTTETQIIIGKFIGNLSLLISALAGTLFYALLLAILGKPDGGILITGYVGLLLLGSAYAAIGIYSSTISKNQIVAFIISFFIIVVLFLLDKFLFFIPGWLSSIVQYISIDYHFQNIVRGVLDSRDIIYYVSIIILFLYLACSALREKKYQ